MENDNNSLKRIFSCIDNTTLEGSDTVQRVQQLCRKSLSMCNPALGVNHVAAVCVYPVFVAEAKRCLEGSNIKVASVAGAFPSGQSPLSVKVSEVRYAVDEGADEIDMVISRGSFLEGNYQKVFDEIAAIREVCAHQRLKVILETGELPTHEHIYKASELAIKAGADFIKTSTGKIAVSATIEAADIMLSAIVAHYKNTGKMVGFKAAGGISTPEQALAYYRMAANRLGERFANNQYFRIGASRLTEKLFALLTQ